MVDKIKDKTKVMFKPIKFLVEKRYFIYANCIIVQGPVVSKAFSLNGG